MAWGDPTLLNLKSRLPKPCYSLDPVLYFYFIDRHQAALTLGSAFPFYLLKVKPRRGLDSERLSGTYLALHESQWTNVHFSLGVKVWFKKLEFQTDPSLIYPQPYWSTFLKADKRQEDFSHVDSQSNLRKNRVQNLLKWIISLFNNVKYKIKETTDRLLADDCLWEFWIFNLLPC